jgi:hypothetical protein
MRRAMKQRLLLLLFLMLTSACMYAPFDGQRVAVRSSTIHFEGLVPAANATVTVKAWNFGTSTWDTVATLSSQSSAGHPFDDNDPYYAWFTDLVLPNTYWAAPPTGLGYYARVKAMYGSANVFSVRGDVGNCYGDHHATGIDFANNCASHRTPEAYIYTNAYQDGPAGCVSIPATTKSRYTVTEIPSCARSVIRDHMLDYLDRDVILAHYDIHHHHPESFFYDHRRYLGKMESYLMVYGNKWIPDGHLPTWAPSTTIPLAFRSVKASPEECSSSQNSSCTSGWNDDPLVDVSPSISTPSGLSSANICQYDTLAELHSAVDGGWHGSVHGAIGGTMSTFDSPSAVIFWPWHTYVDQILADWESCP